MENVTGADLTLEEMAAMLSLELDDDIVAALQQASAADATEPPHTPALTHEATLVLWEFGALLFAAGYGDSRRHGSVSKYKSYMKLLFESGVFQARRDFFSEGARGRASTVYKLAASAKATVTTTKARKLYTNYMHGFDKFVLLARDA